MTDLTACIKSYRFYSTSPIPHPSMMLTHRPADMKSGTYFLLTLLNYFNTFFVNFLFWLYTAN